MLILTQKIPTLNPPQKKNTRDLKRIKIILNLYYIQNIPYIQLDESYFVSSFNLFTEF